MDNLTHTLVGLFLSRAGLKRWTPLATPILMLAANAPDADIVTAAGGSVNYLHFHRHITHSLIAMPLMALISIVLVRLVARKPVNWLGAFAGAMIAVASHLLLDLTNSYGVRLLLPFSERWLRLDQTNVVDIWIWAALLLGIACPFIARLVGSEITSGAGKVRNYGRGSAIAALAFVLLYNCGRGVLHARAVAMLDSRVYENTPPIRVAALPHAVNPWYWHGVAETRDFYAVEDLNLSGEFDPTHATILHKPDPDPALDAAQKTVPFQEFLRFSQFPFWRILPVPEPENAKRVEVIDLRFGSPAAPAFVATALVSSSFQVLETSFSYARIRPR